MIGKLRGQFGGTAGDGVALVEVGGVGYCVRASQSTLGALELAASTQPGSEVILFIHTAVREDAIDLYGFPTSEELGFFRLLCSVSGIGPKTAIGILNTADATALARAIARGEAAALTKVFGIGKKSAERIVVELRDKMQDIITAAMATEGSARHHDTDVLEALMALGYSASESREALKEINPDVLEMRARLSAALHYLGGGKTPTKIA